MSEPATVWQVAAAKMRVCWQRMTIDERLEKLTKRHEALAESVELLAHCVKDLHAAIASTNEAVKETNESLAGLIRIVLNHENCLHDLEEGAA
ncbi:MAG: hypothetical protein SFV18_08485 [Bryobacteraceae bacterium]|nr:hypothetical protein [Bryobacteraceae bacterium]